MKQHFGLLGRKLGHSYSPQIHGLLAEYDYQLYEAEPEAVGTFLKETVLDGMNVTIPYKKTVMEYCAGLSETALRMGCVNTLVRETDGWHGYNTDYDGFCSLVQASGIPVKGKKALVLGSGRASGTACRALEDLGASPVVVISRNGKYHYGNLELHADAELIVNTTPVGMYPANGRAPLDLALFPRCCGVLDVIYNPARTALLLQAEARGIPHAGGLHMLVAQAKRSAELFTGKQIDDGEIDRITGLLQSQTENIVLTGMPGSGKTSIGKELSVMLGREFLDADEKLAEKAGKTIPEIFREIGETGFRKLETEILEELGKLSGKVIATGGGCVTRSENYPLLHQNSRIVWIRRRLDLLPSEGRPISMVRGMEDLFEERKEQYAAFADLIVENDASIKEAAEKICRAIETV